MANTSLYAALAGLPDEQQYYAQDPWYSAGSKTLGMRIDPNIYTNNRDALLYPILQGLAGGAMQGYGEGSALQQALQDASPIYQRITGQEYNPDTAFGPVASGDTYASMLAAGHIQPSIKQIKGDLLAAVLADENKQEIDQIRAKQKAEYDSKFSPEAMAAQAKLKGMEAEAEARGKNTAEGKKNDLGLNAEAQAKIGEQRAIAEEAIATADLIKKTNLNWAQMRAAEQFSGLDESGVTQRVRDLADRLLRLRSGANAPEPEQERLRKIQSGDFSAGPEMVAKYLRQSAQAEYRNIQDKIKTSKQIKEGVFESEIAKALTENPVDIPNTTNIKPPRPPSPGMKWQVSNLGNWREVPQ